MNTNFKKTLLIGAVLISNITGLQASVMLEDNMTVTPITYHLNTAGTSMVSTFLRHQFEMGKLSIENQIEADRIKQADNIRHMRQQVMKERYEVQNKTPIDIELTFYTGLVCENTIHGAVDAIGNDLEYGTIAIPRDFEIGTQFEIDGYDGVFTGTDRGSVHHIKVKDDGTIRLDMFIPRNDGESDNAWWARVNAMGRVNTKGYIIKN